MTLHVSPDRVGHQIQEWQELALEIARESPDLLAISEWESALRRRLVDEGDWTHAWRAAISLVDEGRVSIDPPDYLVRIVE